MITIIQVAKSIGVDLDNSTAWSIGSEMAAAYVDAFGEQPPKELRPKTSGSGTHCFAVYPYSWRAKIIDSIKSRQLIAKSQKNLFDDEGQA
jgi:hypothetical protein